MSKEDLALSFIKDRTALFLRVLAARPPEEEPLAAARNAFHDSLAETASPDSAEKMASYLSVINLIEASPALLAANLRYLHDYDDEIVGVLARREGVDPAVDRRPRLLPAMFGAIAFLASREGGRKAPPVPSDGGRVRRLRRPADRGPRRALELSACWPCRSGAGGQGWSWCPIEEGWS